MTLPNILVLPKDPVKLTRGRESCTESRVLTVTSPVLVSKTPLNMHIGKKRHLEVLNAFRSESFHSLFREFTMVLKVPLFIPLHVAPCVFCRLFMYPRSHERTYL